MKMQWEIDNGKKPQLFGFPLAENPWAENKITGITLTFSIKELASLHNVLMEADPAKLNEDEKFIVHVISEYHKVAKLDPLNNIEKFKNSN